MGPPSRTPPPPPRRRRSAALPATAVRAPRARGTSRGPDVPRWTDGASFGSMRISIATVRPSGQLSGHVVRVPLLCATGRITTSSSVGTSKSTSRLTWRALANGTSTSRLSACLPVSTRLMVDGLRLVCSAGSSREYPRVVRMLRRREPRQSLDVGGSVHVPVLACLADVDDGRRGSGRTASARQSEHHTW